MNTTIRYSFPDDQKFRYMSFPTYEKALQCIKLFKQIEVEAEVKHDWITCVCLRWTSKVSATK